MPDDKVSHYAEGLAVCGGVIAQSIFDSVPWAYMMYWTLPDDIFKEYKEAKEDGRKFMLEYAEKLFKKHAHSAI